MRGPGETSAGKEVLDETHQFRFAGTASGVYTLDVPAGWRARTDADAADLMDIMGAGDMVDDALDPLLGDVRLDVTPGTATLYGRVDGGDGFPVADVTVTANGVSATTDASGRYIIEGIPTATHRISGKNESKKIKLDASVSGSSPATSFEDYKGDNTVTRKDIDLEGRDDDGLGERHGACLRHQRAGRGRRGHDRWRCSDERGYERREQGQARDGCRRHLHGRVRRQGSGRDREVSVKKAGMSFVPGMINAPAHAGSAATGFDFTGLRARQHHRPGGRPGRRPAAGHRGQGNGDDRRRHGVHRRHGRDRKLQHQRAVRQLRDHSGGDR